MSIRTWHFGKLIILWTWGVLLCGLALTHFVSSEASKTPLLLTAEIVFVVLVLVGLSIITWHWLGAKDSN
jgi:hypothetical protein